MTVDDLITHFSVSSDRQLAKRLQKAPSTICHWRLNGIPWDRQAAFQVETKGELKASARPAIAEAS